MFLKSWPTWSARDINKLCCTITFETITYAFKTFCCLKEFSEVNDEGSRLCFFRAECAWRCEGLLQWSFTSSRHWCLQLKSLPHGIQWNLNLLFLTSLIGYDNFLLQIFVLLLLSVSSSEESIILQHLRAFSLLLFFIWEESRYVIKKETNWFAWLFWKTTKMLFWLRNWEIKNGNRETGRLQSKPGELTGMIASSAHVTSMPFLEPTLVNCK